MADLPSRTDLFQVGRRAIVNTPNVRINPSVIDTAGSDVNLLVGAMSVIGENIITQLGIGMRGLFIETAAADALDRVAYDRYGLTRFSATPATCLVTLSRATSGGGAGTFQAGSRVQTTTGVQFAVDADVVFGGSDLIKTASATALVTGLDGNVSANTIVQFADPPWDASLTVTNSGAAGGATTETDVAFRGRIRNFFPTVRRGTLGAIQYGALQVPGVAVATAYEAQAVTLSLSGIAQSLPATVVQLVVSDRDGNSSAPMIQAVQDAMLDYRSAGVAVLVYGGVLNTTTVVRWTGLTYVTGYDPTSVQQQIRSVSVAVAQFLAPGATLYRSTLIAAAKTVPGVIVAEGSLTSPPGDIKPATNSIVLRVLPTNVVFA